MIWWSYNTIGIKAKYACTYMLKYAFLNAQGNKWVDKTHQKKSASLFLFYIYIRIKVHTHYVYFLMHFSYTHNRHINRGRENDLSSLSSWFCPSSGLRVMSQEQTQQNIELIYIYTAVNIAAVSSLSKSSGSAALLDPWHLVSLVSFFTHRPRFRKKDKNVETGELQGWRERGRKRIMYYYYYIMLYLLSVFVLFSQGKFNSQLVCCVHIWCTLFPFSDFFCNRNYTYN